MQTFLPYDDYQASVRCLDYRRLGKQRVECKQIYRALVGESKGWVNHPAVRMWRGHEGALIDYAILVCTEWRSRGYKDSQLEYFEGRQNLRLDKPPPTWFGNYDFHASHRSNLLRKQPEWYSQFKWKEPDDLPYVWPV